MFRVFEFMWWKKVFWSTPLFPVHSSCFVVTVYFLISGWSISDIACCISDGLQFFFLTDFQYKQIWSPNFACDYSLKKHSFFLLFAEQLKVSQHQNDNSSDLITELQSTSFSLYNKMFDRRGFFLDTSHCWRVLADRVLCPWMCINLLTLFFWRKWKIHGRYF